MYRVSNCAVVPLAVMLIACLAAPGAAAADDWTWSITPYFWGSDVKLGVRVNDQEVIDERVDLSDLIDKLDFILSLRAEGQRGRNGWFADLYYADFGDDDRLYDLAGSVPGQVVANGDLEFTILEAGGIFNPSGKRKGFAVLYGLRMFDVDMKIGAHYEFDGGSTADRDYRTSETLWDILAGVRYVGEFAKRGLFDFKVDASAGGTDLTWSALAGAGWTYGKKQQHAVVFGYRYLDIDFAEPADVRADVDTEIELGGFYAALKFGF